MHQVYTDLLRVNAYLLLLLTFYSNQRTLSLCDNIKAWTTLTLEKARRIRAVMDETTAEKWSTMRTINRRTEES